MGESGSDGVRLPLAGWVMLVDEDAISPETLQKLADMGAIVIQKRPNREVTVMRL